MSNLETLKALANDRNFKKFLFEITLAELKERINEQDKDRIDF